MTNAVVEEWLKKDGEAVADLGPDCGAKESARLREQQKSLHVARGEDVHEVVDGVPR